jgi:hypothetical protein
MYDETEIRRVQLEDSQLEWSIGTGTFCEEPIVVPRTRAWKYLRATARTSALSNFVSYIAVILDCMTQSVRRNYR